MRDPISEVGFGLPGGTPLAASGVGAPLDHPVPLRPGDHVCHFFDDDTRRLAAMAAFVSGGLRRNRMVVYITHSLLPLAVEAGLAARGIDTEASVADGRLLIAAADQVLLAAGRPEPDLLTAAVSAWGAEARAAGRAGLRLTADMAWAADAGFPPEAVAGHEARLAQIAAADDATVLCQYDQRVFTATDLRVIAHHHLGPADPTMVDG
ncbi:MEDS domain-containing protein [Allonocardiopsis opalescens]|uniref:DcmR-like sensory protein n=1 Tax=Allonocardiopsis opalescens TaxID=1144618 RepID=A0A2T0Q4V4_9ACTN|nr:MEDS domain-containing protein [Allonocardiopsis opalescens]PRX98834.1 DcmR-like sensory protein [Allonocardiopsis opalescens]